METKNYSFPNNLAANMKVLRAYVDSGGENEAQALASSLTARVFLNAAERAGIDTSLLELEMEQIQKGIDNLEESDYIKEQQNNNN